MTPIKQIRINSLDIFVDEQLQSLRLTSLLQSQDFSIRFISRLNTSTDPNLMIVATQQTLDNPGFVSQIAKFKQKSNNKLFLVCFLLSGKAPPGQVKPLVDAFISPPFEPDELKSRFQALFNFFFNPTLNHPNTTQYFQQFQKKSPFPCISLDQNGRIVDCNKGWEEQTGFSQAESIGTPFNSFIPPDQAFYFDEKGVALINAGSVLIDDLVIINKQKKYIPVFAEARVEYSTKHIFIQSHWVFYTNDAVQKISVTKTRYKTIIENCPISILFIRDNKFVYANPSGLKLLGYTATQIEGLDVSKTISPKDFELIQKYITNIDKTTDSRLLKLSVLQPNGKPISIESIIVPIVLNDGPATLMMSCDVTQVMQSKQALIVKEELLNLVFNSVPSLLIIVDCHGRVVDLNQSCMTLMNKNKKELIDLTLGDMFLCIHPSDGTACGLNPECKHCTLLNRIQQAFLNNKFCSNEEYSFTFIQNQSVRTLDCLLSVSPINLGVKKLALVSMVDISSQKQSLKALDETHRIYKSFLDSSTDMAFIKSSDLRYLLVNRQQQEYFNKKEEDIIGKTDAELLFEGNKESLETDLKVLETKKMITYNIALNGKIYQAQKFPVYIDEQTLSIGGFARDITDQVNAIETIKSNKNQLESLFRITHHETKSIQELMDYTLGEALKLTKSTFGLIYLYDEDKRVFTLNVWSKSTQTICSISEVQITNLLKKTEILKETVHHRKPIIINDYSKQYPHKNNDLKIKQQLLRLLSVPVFYDRKIVAIVGMANKKNNYTQTDVLQLSLLMDSVWKIVRRKESDVILHNTMNRLRGAVESTIQVLVNAVEARDPYTAGHQRRVGNLAQAIATECHLTANQIDGVRMAGIIHDIGKISIPAEILTKPTTLTSIEYSLIKEHSQNGYNILKNIESAWPLAQMVLEHHERLDGSGYPQGLEGDNVLFESRILAVADVVESMASHRPYRPALGIEVALDEIEKNSGILYDPVVVKACLKLFRKKKFSFEDTSLNMPPMRAYKL